MDIEFTICAPPFSVNNAYYKNRQRNTKCRAWGDNILDQLIKHEKMFSKLHKYVSNHLNTHSLTVDLSFYMPYSKLYTKSGKISRNSMDHSNVEKLFLDLIFDKRYNDRGHVNLNLDDALITTLLSKKRVSQNDQYHIKVKIQTVPNNKLT